METKSRAELPDLSLIRAHALFAELSARKTELELRLAAIREERIGLIPAVRDELPGLVRNQPKREASPIMDAARALLGSLLPTPAPEPAPMTSATATARLGELAAEEAAVQAALELLAGPWVAARAEANAAVLELVKPEATRRARALASAVCAMAEAGQHYMDLATAMDREGLAWAELAPISRLPGGPAGVPYSEVRQWLRDAVADGHLEANALPREWREGLALAA